MKIQSVQRSRSCAPPSRWLSLSGSLQELILWFVFSPSGLILVYPISSPVVQKHRIQLSLLLFAAHGTLDAKLGAAVLIAWQLIAMVWFQGVLQRLTSLAISEFHPHWNPLLTPVREYSLVKSKRSKVDHAQQADQKKAQKPRKAKQKVPWFHLNVTTLLFSCIPNDSEACLWMLLKKCSWVKKSGLACIGIFVWVVRRIVRYKDACILAQRMNFLAQSIGKRAAENSVWPQNQTSQLWSQLQLNNFDHPMTASRNHAGRQFAQAATADGWPFLVVFSGLILFKRLLLQV